MLNSNYMYVDYAFGGPANRGNVVDIFNFPKLPDHPVDCYRTYFRFPKGYYDNWKLRGSVSGYTGNMYADFIPLDIDSTELSEALIETKELLAVLVMDYDFEVKQLYFSGAKGFHILLPSTAFGGFKPDKSLASTFKSIVSDIAQGFKLIDTKIYDYNRLLRVRNSINSKTGLWKIQLTIDDLNAGIDHILEKAKKRQPANKNGLDAPVNKQLQELYEKYKYIRTDNGDKVRLADIENGVAEGNRNNSLFNIALTFAKNSDVSKDLIYLACSGINSRNKPPLPENEVKKIVESALNYKDDEDNNGGVELIWRISKEYDAYINDQNKVFIGIPAVDKATRGLRPGQVMTLIGYTGNFKSGILQWILRHHTKHYNEPVMMFELEMSDLDLFERAAQMAVKQTGEGIEDIFKNENEEMKEKLVEKIRSEQEKFAVVTVPGLNVEAIEKYYYIAEQEILKEKIKLVGIDFIQLMSAYSGTNSERIDRLSKDIKELAKRINCPIISVSQVTGVESAYDKIKLMDVRDSKTVSQLSDYVVGLWLGEGQNTQVVQLLKNRRGKLCGSLLKVNRDIFEIEELKSWDGIYTDDKDFA